MTNRRPLCADYADTSFSAVCDINHMLFNGNILTTLEGKEFLITANGITNHDSNDANVQFARRVSEVAYE